eukprot:g2898.t1
MSSHEASVVNPLRPCYVWLLRPLRATNLRSPRFWFGSEASEGAHVIARRHSGAFEGEECRTPAADRGSSGGPSALFFRHREHCLRVTSPAGEHVAFELRSGTHSLGCGLVQLPPSIGAGVAPPAGAGTWVLCGGSTSVAGDAAGNAHPRWEGWWPVEPGGDVHFELERHETPTPARDDGDGGGGGGGSGGDGSDGGDGDGGQARPTSPRTPSPPPPSPPSRNPDVDSTLARRRGTRIRGWDLQVRAVAAFGIRNTQLFGAQEPALHAALRLLGGSSDTAAPPSSPRSSAGVDTGAARAGATAVAAAGTPLNPQWPLADASSALRLPLTRTTSAIQPGQTATLLLELWNKSWFADALIGSTEAVLELRVDDGGRVHATPRSGAHTHIHTWHDSAATANASAVVAAAPDTLEDVATATPQRLWLPLHTGGYLHVQLSCEPCGGAAGKGDGVSEGEDGDGREGDVAAAAGARAGGSSGEGGDGDGEPTVRSPSAVTQTDCDNESRLWLLTLRSARRLPGSRAVALRADAAAWWWQWLGFDAEGDDDTGGLEEGADGEGRSVGYVVAASLVSSPTDGGQGSGAAESAPAAGAALAVRRRAGVVPAARRRRAVATATAAKTKSMREHVAESHVWDAVWCESEGGDDGRGEPLFDARTTIAFHADAHDSALALEVFEVSDAADSMGDAGLSSPKLASESGDAVVRGCVGSAYVPLSVAGGSRAQGASRWQLCRGGTLEFVLRPAPAGFKPPTTEPTAARSKLTRQISVASRRAMNSFEPQLRGAAALSALVERPIMEGWLIKRSMNTRLVHSWRRRYFRLLSPHAHAAATAVEARAGSGGGDAGCGPSGAPGGSGLCLAYYKSDVDVIARGVIPIDGACRCAAWPHSASASDVPAGFLLHSSLQQPLFVVSARAGEAKVWLSMLAHHIGVARARDPHAGGADDSGVPPELPSAAVAADSRAQRALRLALRKQWQAAPLAEVPPGGDGTRQNGEDTESEQPELQRDCGNATVLCEGRLRKLSSLPLLGRVWRSRYFCLVPSGLAYFRPGEIQRGRARGVFRISARTACACVPEPGQQWERVWVSGAGPAGDAGRVGKAAAAGGMCHSIVVRDVQRELRLCAPDARETQRWFRAIADRVHAMGGAPPEAVPEALRAAGAAGPRKREGEDGHEGQGRDGSGASDGLGDGGGGETDAEALAESVVDKYGAQQRLLRMKLVASRTAHLAVEETMAKMAAEGDGNGPESGPAGAAGSGTGAGGAARTEAGVGSGAEVHADIAAPACTVAFQTAMRQGSVRLGDLQVLTTLGRGSFGTVMLARHGPTGQVCAVKTMLKTQVIATRQTRQVAREATVFRVATTHGAGADDSLPLLRGALASDAAFVAQLFDTYHDRDRLYMLMEFLQGGELFGLLYEEYSPLTGGKGGMSRRDTCFYVACASLALRHLHCRCSIVFRDLKLENIVLDSRGYAKLVDMGAAVPYTPELEDECDVSHFEECEFGSDDEDQSCITLSEMSAADEERDPWPGFSQRVERL